MTPEDLKQLRLSINLTQQQVADILGLSLNTINAFEAGRADIPGWLAKFGEHLFRGCPECGHKLIEPGPGQGRSAPRGPRENPRAIHFTVIQQLLDRLAMQVGGMSDHEIGALIWGAGGDRILCLHSSLDLAIPDLVPHLKTVKQSARAVKLGRFREDPELTPDVARRQLMQILRTDEFSRDFWHPRGLRRPSQAAREALREAGWSFVRKSQGPGVIMALDEE